MTPHHSVAAVCAALDVTRAGYYACDAAARGLGGRARR